MSFDVLFQRADIWRGGETPPAVNAGIASGFAQLDALLPGGGWPRGALSEILAAEGHGALSLIMPALVRLGDEDRSIALVAPPYLPYPPALAACGISLMQVLCVWPRDQSEQLWALAQCLRSHACAAVLSWFAQPPVQHLRRLQLAAEAGGALACLFYPLATTAHNTPAALRLAISPHTSGVSVRILKRRGGWPCGPVYISAT